LPLIRRCTDTQEKSLLDARKILHNRCLYQLNLHPDPAENHEIERVGSLLRNPAESDASQQWRRITVRADIAAHLKKSD
jgi:hypothetical protein